MYPRTSEDSMASTKVEPLPGYNSDEEEPFGTLLHMIDAKAISDIEEVPLYDEASPSGSLWNWLRKSVFIMVNVAASVGIIFYNKHALGDSQLSRMPVTIVAVHSLCTAAVMWGASRKPVQLFEPIHTPIRSLLTLSLGFPAYVIMGLLSVSHNPVGIYQLGKVMNSPVVVFLNYLFFSSPVSAPTLMSIFIMCTGVAATIHGGWATTTPFGLSLVASSTCAAALYQICIGLKHKELGLSSPQLVYQQSRLSGVLLLFAIPFLDQVVSPSKLTWSAISGLLGTGMLASVVNLSQFLVIESTSALTFNVASQLKTCLVLVIAWLVAEKPPSLVDYAGVVVTMVGSACYAYVALKERKQNSTNIEKRHT